MNTSYAGTARCHPTHSRPIAAYRSTHERPEGAMSLLPVTELRRLVAAMVD
ncbi:hypothetical protein [Novosphingobium sp.]|uniref:hypothetical protein n=1 Tax=Novosphingobium sp. TaxID=1874826 RepID=UPI0026330B37|nr:hypothetical protein [Novosphingobium sp.]